jgi:hypothetical protein
MIPNCELLLIYSPKQAYEHTTHTTDYTITSEVRPPPFITKNILEKLFITIQVQGQEIHLPFMEPEGLLVCSQSLRMEETVSKYKG